MRLKELNRASATILVALAVAATVAGCSATPVPSAPSGGQSPAASDSAEQPAATDTVSAAAALVQERYELVRDGDYGGACALYSADYADLFIELAAAEGGTCAEAHAKATQNSDDYQATAADQGRAGLTPFFFIPSSIEVDSSAIKSDEEGVAFLGEGTVVSLDTTEFEDGTGLTPGWLAGQDYVKQQADGSWLFISALEK